MKSQKFFERITFGIIYSVLLLATIILLCLKRYGEAMFVGLPMVVLFPIYLTFLWQYQGKSLVKGMVLGNIVRLLLILIGILGPALIWYFVPSIHEATSSYLVFVPAVEVLGIYTYVMIHFTRLGKINGDDRK